MTSVRSGKGKTVNKSEMAAICGVSLTGFNAWVNQGLPNDKIDSTDKRKQYNTAVVIRWLEERAKLANMSSMGNSDKINYDVEKARTEKNRADKLEMENRKTRGELLERAEVLEGLQKTFSAVRAKLLAIPNKATPVVITLGEQSLVQHALTEMAHDALEELSCFAD